MSKNIKYTNRDFDNIKKDIKSYLKATYPDYTNFSENSSSQILIDTVCYVGDVLNYYIDSAFQEIFLDSAIEKDNIINTAKLLGYKYQGKTRSIVDVDFFITVPYINNNNVIEPDSRYFMTIKKGTIVKSNTVPTQYFEIIEDCDFNYYDDIKIASRVDDNDADSAALTYALQKRVKAINGKRKTETFDIGDFEEFKKIKLSEENILDIVSITDDSNNQYYEVNYLAQDSVFQITTNSSTSENTYVPYIVSYTKVPRRFIKEVNSNNETIITFGAGDGLSDDATLTPSPYQYVLSSTSYAGNTIDPNNFLSTSTLGIAPSNTTLTVVYRYGGGVESNVPAGSINALDEITYEWPTNDILAPKQDVYASVAVYNIEPAQGGENELNINELRHFASAKFASQDRAVTLTDYITLIYTMPQEFGSVYRIYAESSTASDTSINLYLLTLNENGNLVSPYTSLKNNIKEYLKKYRMINDTIYIQSGTVINIGIEFDIVTSSSFNKSEILLKCISELKSKFDISNMDFNKPIIKSEVYDLLHSVQGVISVSDVRFINLSGTINGRTYSSTEYNLDFNTKNNIIFSRPSYIFEIKYPNSDIIGKVVTSEIKYK